MRLTPEIYLELAQRCTDLADRAYSDPYNTADGYYWLDHAERMGIACDTACDLLEAQS